MQTKAKRLDSRNPLSGWRRGVLLLGAMLSLAPGVTAAVVKSSAGGGVAVQSEPGSGSSTVEVAEAGAGSAKVGRGDRQGIVIKAIEPEGGSEEATWLGVGVEEAPEALSVQLGLKPGEGLVVTVVTEDSPAAKAGLQKNDVLTEFEGQTLVLPAQLRKLVRMRKPGDEVRLVFYRAGRKQEVTATLGQTKLSGLLGEAGDWDRNLLELRQHWRELPIGEAIREQLKELRQSLGRSGFDGDKLGAEIKRSLEEARKALEKALREATNAGRSVGPVAGILRDLARSGVHLDNQSVVTIKRSANSVATVVKTDESGTYVVIANPAKRLTAHDKEGKLLFEGEIETSEQQAKVPPEIWAKVKPMLDQLKPAPKAEDDL